jgi:hypothetical protein
MQTDNKAFAVTIDFDGEVPEVLHLSESQVLALTSLGANAIFDDYRNGVPFVEGEIVCGSVEPLTPNVPVMVHGAEYNAFYAGEFLSRGIIAAIMESVADVEKRYGLS